MRCKFIVIAFIAFAISISLVGCGSKNKTENAGEKSKILPKFSFEGSNGKKYTDKDFRSGVGVMSFVASWCGPCGAELAEIDSIAQKYSKILALAVTYEPPEFYSELFDSLKIKIPLVQADSSFFAAIGISKLPTRLLIDKGKIISQIVGAPLPKDSEFYKKLKQALGIEDTSTHGN